MALNSNQMEGQIGRVLHWSNQKEPEQAKSKDEVIRRNLDRIHISTVIPVPSNPSQAQPSELHSKNKKPHGSRSGVRSKQDVLVPGHHCQQL